MDFALSQRLIHNTREDEKLSRSSLKPIFIELVNLSFKGIDFGASGAYLLAIRTVCRLGKTK